MKSIVKLIENLLNQGKQNLNNVKIVEYKVQLIFDLRISHNQVKEQLKAVKEDQIQLDEKNEQAKSDQKYNILNINVFVNKQKYDTSDSIRDVIKSKVNATNIIVKQLVTHNYADQYKSLLLQQEVEDIKKYNDQLAELMAFGSQLDSRSKELDEVKKQLDFANKDIEKLKNDLTVSSTKSKEVQKLFNEMNKKIKEMEKLLPQNADKEKQQRDEEMKKKNELIEHLKAEIQSMETLRKSTLEKTQMDLAIKDSVIEDLNQKLLDKEYDILESERKQVFFENKIEQYQITIEQCNQKILRMQVGLKINHNNNNNSNNSNITN